MTDESKAKLVEVAQAAEASNIDIAVGRTIDGFTVSGRMVDAETGQPLSGARFGVAIMSDGRGRGFTDVAGASDSNGNSDSTTCLSAVTRYLLYQEMGPNILVRQTLLE